MTPIEFIFSPTTLCMIIFLVILSVSIIREATSPVIKHGRVKAIAKRMKVTGRRSARTQYYMTFESKNGERQEYRVNDRMYGEIIEGDYGTLSTKLNRVTSFERVASRRV